MPVKWDNITYVIRNPSAAKMTVHYWILPLFWDDGKLEFDCSKKAMLGLPTTKPGLYFTPL